MASAVYPYLPHASLGKGSHGFRGVEHALHRLPLFAIDSHGEHIAFSDLGMVFQVLNFLADSRCDVANQEVLLVEVIQLNWNHAPSPTVPDKLLPCVRRLLAVTAPEVLCDKAVDEAFRHGDLDERNFGDRHLQPAPLGISVGGLLLRGPVGDSFGAGEISRNVEDGCKVYLVCLLVV